MNRLSFLKAAVVAMAAPKVVIEVAREVAKPPLIGNTFFGQLHMAIPDYLSTMIAKYGNENFTILRDELFKGAHVSEFHHYDHPNQSL